MKLMYLSVAQSQIGNDFILLLHLFIKNKVVDSQNKVVDWIALIKVYASFKVLHQIR
jgi:hypothetical protein